MVADRWLGAELAGYRIVALVGRGASGVVYRATHLQLQRPAALKLLAPGLATDAEFRHRFEREARLAASLNHSHIVPVYDAGYTQDVLYLAMRFIDGPNLASLIEKEAPVALPEVCELLTGVAEALDSAHQAGLVHRDIKPANILVASPDQRSPRRRGYLCDFGIARLASANSALTSTGQFLGTLQYCAPEQIQGQPLDGRADQYALACTVFHCLTGQLPYPADELAAVMFAHVSAAPPRPSAYLGTPPTAVDEVLATALAKQPAARFPDCATFLRALAAAGDSPSGGVAPPGFAPPLTEPPTIPAPSPATPAHGPPTVGPAGFAPRTMAWPPRPPGHGHPPPTDPSHPAGPAGPAGLNTRRRALSPLAIAVLVLVGVLVLLGAGLAIRNWTSGPAPVAIKLPIKFDEGDGGLAISPDGRRAFSVGMNSVSIIDTASNSVSATIPVPHAVGGEMAITPDGRTAYVTKSDAVYNVRSVDHDYSNIVVLDTARNVVAGTIPSPVSGFARGVAIAPDGRHAYVSLHPDGSDPQAARYDYVLVIDTSRNAVTSTIPVRPGTNLDLAIAPDGRHLYLADAYLATKSHGMLVIDTESNTVTATTPIAGEARGIATTPDGQYVYLAVDHSDPDQSSKPGVLVISTASNTILAEVPLDLAPGGIAISGDGKHACVTTPRAIGENSDSLVTIDTTSKRITETVPAPPGETFHGPVGLSPDGKRAYVPTADSLLAIPVAQQ